MGAASSSRFELEAAQTQVQKLTAQLASVTRKNAAGSTLAAAAKFDADRLAEAKQKLSAQSQQLRVATLEASQLKAAVGDVPRFKADIARAAEELKAAKDAGREKGAVLSAVTDELRASKEELERVFGQLKFSQQEGNAVGRLRADLSEAQQALAEQQRAAAETSARLVSEASTALEASAAGGAAEVHPVFGELLCDFGHKKLFRGSPATLWAGTLLWERQRAFRQERAALIATAKAKSDAVGWPGAVAVVEQPGGGEGAPALGMLIDGQHRLGAAHLLAERGKLNPSLASILVEVYPPMADDAVKELFIEINKAEPVHLVDLPVGGASYADNAALTGAAETLRERYPAMFKPSQACKPPHVNVDVLRANMHSAGLLDRLKLTSAEQLVEWLESTNGALGARDDEAWRAHSAKERPLEKAKAQSFFLGLGWAWLHPEVSQTVSDAEKAPAAAKRGAAESALSTPPPPSVAAELASLDPAAAEAKPARACA